jgi:surface antigen
VSWPAIYSGTAAARLWRGCARFRLAPLVLACALLQGGCALSYRLDSIFGAKDDARKGEVTGAISQESFAAATAADLLDADLVYAKAAAVELLARGGDDASAGWENPATGAHGTVTPIAPSRTQDEKVCRDFLASYVRAGKQAWLHGEACRVASGRWNVKTLKPFTRT